MTREEAIRMLSNRDAHGVPCGYTSGYQEAFDMAVDALQYLQEWGDILQGKPVKHGKWEEKETHLNEGDCEITEWQSARCSKCGKYHTTPYMYSFTDFNYCPHCGAKMDKR